MIFNKLASYEVTYGITINNKGTLTATGSTFTRNGNATETTSIQVGTGGTFSATGGTISVDSLVFGASSDDTMTTNVFAGTFNVNSAATVDIAYNDFSNVGNQGIIASGTQGSTIVMEHNYWGVTTTGGIDAKILDGNTVPSSNRPVIDFQNWLLGSSGTAAEALATNYSTSDQMIDLTANVTTSTGVTISEGQETFTILEGTQVLGQTTTPVNVLNGSAKATYDLPKLTPPGQYTIEANYLGSADYPPATDISHFLTVNSAADQSRPLPMPRRPIVPRQTSRSN